MSGRHGDRPGPHAWDHDLAVAPFDRLEGGRRSRRGNERPDERDRSERGGARTRRVPQQSPACHRLAAVGRFDGKRALVLGVANKRSIAWAIARRLADEGARARVHVPGRADRGERARACRVGRSKLVTACDVRSDEDIERVFKETAEAWDGSSTCSSTRSRSPPPRISRAASPTRRATVSGWRSTSAPTRSSPLRARPSR